MEPWNLLEPISLNSVSLDVECFGDSTGSMSIQISPNATSPYSTVWNPDWVSGLEPANLPAGTYSITVTDANGQTATSIVTIDQPTVLNATSNTTAETGSNANGTATAVASGGVPPYTFLWNTTPPQTTQSADSSGAQEHMNVQLPIATVVRLLLTLLYYKLRHLKTSLVQTLN